MGLGASPGGSGGIGEHPLVGLGCRGCSQRVPVSRGGVAVPAPLLCATAKGEPKINAARKGCPGERFAQLPAVPEPGVSPVVPWVLPFPGVPGQAVG